MYMGIGKRIREARLLKGMSREQLASLLNITVSSIGNYENDVSHPKEEILIRLFHALGVDANFLFQDQMTPEMHEFAAKRDNPSTVTLVAHRENGYDTDLPEEAQEELEHLLDYLKSKYKKKG